MVASTTNRAVGRPSKDRAKNRPKRSSFNSMRDILSTRNVPDGKVARWVNDVEDRIYRFRDAGWEFVTDQNVVVGEPTVEANKEVGAVVCRKVGGGITAYLMVLDKDIYEERMAEQQSEIDDVEKELLRELNSGGDGRYGKVKIS